MNLVVTATSSASISLNWTAPAGGVANYRVERSERISGPFVFIGNTAGTTFTDTIVTAPRAYLYRVLAITADACSSLPSNIVLGTAVSFEFSQLQGQQIKAVHFHDVRTATNAVRTVANLPPASWARPTLTNNLEIKATDVQELRTQLSEALTALEITIIPWEDPILNTGSSGTPIKAIHIEQLQARSTRGVLNNSMPLQATSEDVSQVGRFDSAITLPLVPIHLSVLPDGRVLFWGRDMDVADRVRQISGKSEAYVWNMADGSNKTDVAIFRPSESKWYIINHATGAVRVTPWGLGGDRPVPGDYDGDGSADLAVYRASDPLCSSNSLWGIVNSSDGRVIPICLGSNGDIPVPADYDQDGKTDAAVFRPSDNTWHIRKSSNSNPQAPASVTQWGESGDIPVPGDYDQDRKTDIAVFRPSQNVWHILKSSSSIGSALLRRFGITGDVPAPGDYSGDGATDLAVYRPSDGRWYIRNIVTERDSDFFVGQSPSAIVAPGDYDGDGKTDAAIFRSSEGNWQISYSSKNGEIEVKTWGQNGDVPVPKDYDGMLRVANTTTNLFCSGHSFLPDGRLFVAGGHKSPDFDRDGEPHTNIFDYRTNCWSRGPDMNNGRWYPYNVTLSTGEALIMAGDYFDTMRDPDIFVTNLDPQVYSGGSSLRTLSRPESLTLYPYLHLAPNGKVLQVQSGFLNPSDSKTLSQLSRWFDPFGNQGSGSWESLESTHFPHAMGTSVLFDSGRKALVVGGFDTMFNPTKEAEFIDLTETTPRWKPGGVMNFPRAYHTATILPDGKVLVTGGVRCQGLSIGCGTVLNAEMWDPAANPACPAQVPWRIMAQHKEVRAYHSIAALLPDATVLVGGGGLPGAIGETDRNGTRILKIDNDHARLFGHKSVEIYSPPYLFTGTKRPSITSAPASISYGETFSVSTSDHGPAPKVSLVRLASVTHGFIQDQRHVFLNTSGVTTSGMNITAPADSKICPPGYYMLFILNNGVPSVSKIVKVQQGQTTSLFATDVPATTASGEGSTWEQGVEFSSSVSGQITHIRFWKAPGETAGNHVGRIWTATGALLASVSFPCESASGWQEVQLHTPLQITVGVTYRVTYNVHSFVAKTSNVLDSPITRGPLTARRSFFSSPAGSFPTRASGSNLFADFVFKTQ
jgi:hypothetical protein